MDDKPALRSRLKVARARRDQTELDRLAALIAQHGITCAEHASVIAAYAAVGDEPPTRQLVDELVDAERTVLLPIRTPSGLTWGSYTGWDALAERRGLLEPVDEAAEGLANVDLVFAPALAVDRTGNRLGRGGGYYDRALVAVPRERIVAVVFADEVLDVVPADDHDVRVGAALTPDGVVDL